MTSPQPGTPTPDPAQDQLPPGSRPAGRWRTVAGWVLVVMGVLAILGDLAGTSRPGARSAVPGGILFILTGAALVWWGYRARARGLTRPTVGHVLGTGAAALGQAREAGAARRQVAQAQRQARREAARAREAEAQARAAAEQAERDRQEQERREAERQRQEHEHRKRLVREAEERGRARAAAEQAERDRRERERREAEEKEQRERLARLMRQAQERERQEQEARQARERAVRGYMDGTEWVPPRPSGRPVEPWDPYGESVNVAGLSYRQEPLRLLARRSGHRQGGDAARLEVELLLVPDTHNPYGQGTAVAVYLGEDHTGYLPQADADRMHPHLAPLAQRGVVLKVPGRAWVGDTAMFLSAWLPQPDAILPSNGLPQAPYALLPRGQTIQVTKEDEHMDVLAGYVVRGAGAVNHVAATLVSINEIRPRSSYEAVQVEIDGQRVGVLTKLQSGKLLPLVRHVEERGLLPVVRAKVTGTRLRAEVVLSTVTADSVDDDWIDALGPATGPANIDQGDPTARPDFDWDDQDTVSTTADAQGLADRAARKDHG